MDQPPANDVPEGRRLFRQDGLAFLSSELLSAELQLYLTSSIGYWTGSGTQSRRFICSLCKYDGMHVSFKSAQESFKHTARHYVAGFGYARPPFLQCIGCLRETSLLHGGKHMSACIKLQCRSCKTPIVLTQYLSLEWFCDCRKKYSDKRDWIEFVSNENYLETFLALRDTLSNKSLIPDSDQIPRDFAELMKCRDVDDFSLEESINIVVKTATAGFPIKF